MPSARPSEPNTMNSGSSKLTYTFDPANPGWSDEVNCEKAALRGQIFREELERAEREQENIVSTRCKGTIKRAVDTVGGWRGPHERAWVCDGRIVDAPLTRRYMAASSRLTDWKLFMARHCPDTVRQ